MSEHTKTPWHQGADERQIESSVDGTIVCIVQGAKSHPCVIPDSELIVKAVNNHEKLVEALRDVCDMWATVCGANGWDADHLVQYETARTLLANLEAEKGGGEL